MRDFIKNCENTISSVQGLLEKNPEWVSRYAEYARKINAKTKDIKENKQKFHERPPLYLYMNVSAAKSHITFSLRYRGQNVAKLKVGKDKITISTEGFDVENKRDFKYDIKLKDCDWRSPEAVFFRRHFSGNNQRTKNSPMQNEEHRLESLLLTEFSKRSSKNKLLCNIQPIKLANLARFQMPTPLSASNMKKVKYSKQYGGGIDIISRIGTGRTTKICIMELKKENISKEQPTKAIQQGLAYATFIRELLRSNSGEEWWKIFGFKGKLPEHIELYVVCVMPSTVNNDKSFAGNIIKNDQDSFHLHYIYFREENNKLRDIETSLEKCNTKNYI
jgi:hypothetical protein